VHLAAAAILPNLAEHHFAQRLSVEFLPPEDVLQWAVHVDRIDDRVAVCRDVEQRVRLTVLCLRRQSFGLNDSVEALSTHPLTRVGVLERHRRFDSLWEVSDRLCEGD